MSDHAVFLIVLAACLCGAVIAVGVVECAVWSLRQQKRGKG